MPGSMVRNFTDPDNFSSGIRATEATLSITRRGTFAAKVVRINLNRLWMQHCSDNLPRIAHLHNVPGRAIFSFLSQSYPSLTVDGLEFLPGTILKYREAASGFQRSAGPLHVASMSLPIADAEALGATFGDLDLTPPRDTAMTFPALAPMERLQRLHAAAGHLAEHAPDIVASPQAAYGLEQALVGALADCLGAADRSVAGCRSHARIKIMHRLYAILEVNTDQVFHVPEICKMLGVSNRTLTTCCQEALGMSPRRYFRVRQLNLAHRALRLARPQTTSVTEIATAHGFWELGRFSAAHQALFGELPSATLRRAQT